jgi:F0F1-type ATP synthase assembly protein I
VNENPRAGSANRALQDNLDGSESIFFASYGLIGAIVLIGTIGYAADRWLNTAPWMLIAGLASGIAVGFYGLIRASRLRR